MYTQSHSGLQGQAIREAKGSGEERPYHLLTAYFSIPDSGSCAELRGQRSPWSPSVIGTALHFPHAGGLVRGAAVDSLSLGSPQRCRLWPGLWRGGGRREVSPKHLQARTKSSSPLPLAGRALAGSCQPGRQGRGLKSSTDSQQPARSPGCRQPRCAVPLELSLGYHLCRVRCRLLRRGRGALGLPCGQREGGIAAGRQAEGRKEGGRAD